MPANTIAIETHWEEDVETGDSWIELDAVQMPTNAVIAAQRLMDLAKRYSQVIVLPSHVRFDCSNGYWVYRIDGYNKGFYSLTLVPND